MRRKKLGVIVPYRNRKEHLRIFKRRLSAYLKNNEIPYEIIVVNQDDARLFNRGMLLNIGFVHAKQLKCDYVAFHDVDMLPIDVDYSYSEYPIHLATNFIDRKTKLPTREIFDEYFGGVTIFPTDIFEKINGYSNKYWGWGFEDTDLLNRCKIHNVPLDNLKIKNHSTTGIKLKFNGVDAYVEAKNFGNLINLNSNFTIYVSFYPDDVKLNHEKERDDYPIFSIPGFNTDISYNSFKRYTFRTFDKEGNNISLYSSIKTNYSTALILTFNSDTKTITMYQDGIKIGTKKYSNELHDYTLEQIFYIGCEKNQSQELGDFYKGYFSKLALFKTILNDDEIRTISNDDINLVSNTGDYRSSKKLALYYDTNYITNYQLVDLSGNQNNGIIHNCEIITPEIEEYKVVKIPFRRKSEFYSLSHDENGFVDNKWKDSLIRWNQLRFHNEVYYDSELSLNDGLSDLNYVVYGTEAESKIIQLNVGI